MIRFLIALGLLALALYGAYVLFDVDFKSWEDGSVQISACAPWADCSQ